MEVLWQIIILLIIFQLCYDLACENSHLSSARHDVIGYKDSKSNHYDRSQTLQNSGRKIILCTINCLELRIKTYYFFSRV